MTAIRLNHGVLVICILCLLITVNLANVSILSIIVVAQGEWYTCSILLDAIWGFFNKETEKKQILINYLLKSF